jgi:hypothetical protein
VTSATAKTATRLEKYERRLAELDEQIADLTARIDQGNARAYQMRIEWIEEHPGEQVAVRGSDSKIADIEGRS